MTSTPRDWFDLARKLMDDFQNQYVANVLVNEEQLELAVSGSASECSLTLDFANGGALVGNFLPVEFEGVEEAEALLKAVAQGCTEEHVVDEAGQMKRVAVTFEDGSRFFYGRRPLFSRTQSLVFRHAPYMRKPASSKQLSP